MKLDEKSWTRNRIYKAAHRSRIRELDKAYYEGHKKELLAKRKEKRAARRAEQEAREGGGGYQGRENEKRD